MDTYNDNKIDHLRVAFDRGELHLNDGTRLELTTDDITTLRQALNIHTHDCDLDDAVEIVLRT